LKDITINGEEAALVSELSKGNLLAFNSLFEVYSNRLYYFAFKYLKSEAESEELVQEVFTRIWEKRHNLNKDLSFKSFLFTIAFNIIKKHFIAKARLDEYLKSQIRDELDLDTSDNITYDSLYKYIIELVNQLPDRRKVIFIKSRLENLSITKIAEELNISHKTVENQLTSALHFLRDKINKKEFLLFCFSICLFFS